MEPVNKEVVKFYMNGIANGDIQLPEFQRSYEWKQRQASELFESVFLKHPIGTVLLLEIDAIDPLFAWSTLSGVDEIPNDRKFVQGVASKNPPQYLVLDGQQRLTTFYHLTKNSGSKTWYLVVEKLFQHWDDGGRPKNERAIDEWLESIELSLCFRSGIKSELPAPVATGAIKFPLSWLENDVDYTDNINMFRKAMESSSIRFADNNNAIKAKLFADYADFIDGPLRMICGRYFNTNIPTVIIDKSATITGVCKVFTKINTTGLRLGPFDLTVAKLYPTGERLKNRLEDTLENNQLLKVVEKDRVKILSVVALMAGKSPKKAQLPATIKREYIVAHWDTAVAALVSACECLSAHCGAGLEEKDDSLLVYGPMLAPLAFVLAKYPINTTDPHDTYTDRIKKLKIWYYSAALQKYYSEGTDNKQILDASSFSEWFSSTNGVKPDWLDNISIPTLDNSKSGARGKLVLSLMNAQYPKDWHDGGIVGRSNVAAHDSELHHIFPKAYLKNLIRDRVGCSDREAENLAKEQYKYDSVLNLAWLKRKTNSEIINDAPPSEYCAKLADLCGETSLKDFMRSHLINDESYDCLKNDDYHGFVDARSKYIYMILSEYGITMTNVTPDDESFDEDDQESD